MSVSAEQDLGGENPVSGESAASPSPPPSSPSPYAAGAVIADRYELLGLLGQGGIGQVWLAKDKTLQNEVALKLFVRGGPGDGAERLLGEARAAAALEHPAIVRVFDYGETTRGDPFLVMEHLKGEALDELLHRVGPIEPSRAMKLLLPLIDALSIAHGKLVIHRDIKPANLFLAVDETQRVQPKLIDFGLARLQSGSIRHTQEGMLVGSPAYMSPEQIRSKDVDARSDLWSLCVVFYELVTGHLPFGGENQYEMFKAIVEGEATPLPLGGEIDEALIQIMRRGLAKSPTDRFANARDLGVAFARWLVAHGHTEDICGAVLEKEWLKPRKISSLAPPTPAIAFVPPGLNLLGPSSPRTSSPAALAATQEAVATNLDTTGVVAPPRRRWVAPVVVLLAASAAATVAWFVLPREGSDPVAAAAASTSAAPSASASASAKKVPSVAATIKPPVTAFGPTVKPSATATATARPSVKPTATTTRPPPPKH